MDKAIKEYNSKNLIAFSVNIEQEFKENQKVWKKKPTMPFNWQNLDKAKFKKDYNGIALLTGKKNNIVVIDIDNISHWEKLLKENNAKEPVTVKAESGSGGIHLYFKYTNDLENITSKDHKFGKEYDIDLKSNGGCIYVSPTKYHNNNLNKEVSYIWKKSILDYDPIEIPDWLKKLLFKHQEIKKETKKEKKLEIKQELQNIEIDDEDTKLNFTINDIELIVNMLAESRCDCYNDWISVGMCLNNIDSKYLLIWIKWSQQNNKYCEGDCEEKWKSFKREKSGLKIGSLLMWAKNDNIKLYEDFMRKKKMNIMIRTKFPNDKLELGETIIVSDKCSYTHLHNNECLIKGNAHNDLPKSMYIEMLKDLITIKCRHAECFGKIYPCHHVQLTKQEMNIAFNGDVTININNTHDDDFVEFQQIDIYDDPKLNELVFNSLNGESYPCAEITFHYYKNLFNYGEDENWYFYDNHRWKCIGKKNMELRDLSQKKLKELYADLIKYYKENNHEKHKLKSLKQIIKSFDNTNLKNNILTELMEIYTINKNPKRDFTTKLDSNNLLIGFDNGVYDLTTFEFRKGQPEDYITMSVGYDYTDKHTEKYDDLLIFLQDIQPNKNERDYMLTYLSIGLVGNLLELFTILTGCGRNGKSKLIELLGKTLGEYFGSVQSQMFTRPRPDANSPDPGLLSLMKKRIVIASEPEKNSKLNSGFIKFITGRDSTTLRNCHSNDMIEFTARFETLLICNDIPDCDDIDNAFSKRLRCINFPTEFVSDPKKDNQKKIDVNINKKFDFWKLDFMLLLIDYYKKYIQSQDLKATDNILRWTNQYKEETDLYLHFLNECTEESQEEHVHCSTLYDAFKCWFKNNNPNTKIPSNKEFVANLRKNKEICKVFVDKKSQIGIKNLVLMQN
jgi:P4 family phage/plasmid primase-like protien